MSKEEEEIEQLKDILLRIYELNKKLSIDKGFLHVNSTLGEDIRKALKEK